MNVSTTKITYDYTNKSHLALAFISDLFSLIADYYNWIYDDLMSGVYDDLTNTQRAILSYDESFDLIRVERVIQRWEQDNTCSDLELMYSYNFMLLLYGKKFNIHIPIIDQLSNTVTLVSNYNPVVTYKDRVKKIFNKYSVFKNSTKLYLDIIFGSDFEQLSDLSTSDLERALSDACSFYGGELLDTRFTYKYQISKFIKDHTDEFLSMLDILNSDCVLSEQVFNRTVPNSRELVIDVITHAVNNDGLLDDVFICALEVYIYKMLFENGHKEDREALQRTQIIKGI